MEEPARSKGGTGGWKGECGSEEEAATEAMYESERSEAGVVQPVAAAGPAACDGWVRAYSAEGGICS